MPAPGFPKNPPGKGRSPVIRGAATASASPSSFFVNVSVGNVALWRPGVRRGLSPKELEKFALFIAGEYKKEIQKAIDTQRYRGHWKPLSPAYLKEKKRKGLSLKTWEATSLLKDGIRVIKRKNQWIVGPDPHAIYPGTSVSVLFVARCLEYGTLRIPPRPLFRPLAEYISKHISDYQRRFEKANR